MRKILLPAFFAAILAGAGAANAASPNLVANGDFETGDFPSWTTSFANPKADNVALEDGSHGYYWEGGQVGTLGEISQTISTVVGTAYTLSFDLQGNDIPNEFRVSFGEKLVPFAQTDFNYPDWTHITITGLLADSTRSVLKLGSRNDLGYNKIDNISLTAAVPEPETYAMLLAGLGLMATIARRRRNKQA